MTGRLRGALRSARPVPRASAHRRRAVTSPGRGPPSRGELTGPTYPGSVTTTGRPPRARLAGGDGGLPTGRRARVAVLLAVATLLAVVVLLPDRLGLDHVLPFAVAAALRPDLAVGVGGVALVLLALRRRWWPVLVPRRRCRAPRRPSNRSGPRAWRDRTGTAPARRPRRASTTSRKGRLRYTRTRCSRPEWTPTPVWAWAARTSAGPPDPGAGGGVLDEKARPGGDSQDVDDQGHVVRGRPGPCRSGGTRGRWWRVRAIRGNATAPVVLAHLVTVARVSDNRSLHTPVYYARRLIARARRGFR